MSYNQLDYKELLDIALYSVGRLPWAVIEQHTRRGDCFVTVDYDGVVVPKERPRKGRGGHVYTPKKTQDFEEAVAEAGRQAMLEKGYWAQFTFPLEMNLQIRQGVPSKWPDWMEKLGSVGLVYHSVKDQDNMMKAVTDGLNGIVYLDDRQIKKSRVEMLADEPAGFSVTFSPIGLTKDETTRIEKIVRQIKAGAFD